MNIDFEKLREDLKQESYAAAFVGGFDSALMESYEIDDAEDIQLLMIAKEKSIDLNRYIEN
jgi:hypothetical protein